jgi:hypothetical protein
MLIKGNQQMFNFTSGMSGKKLHWYAIEKSEVLMKNIRGIEKLMKALETTGKQSRQSVTLTFSGYDHVVDEIFEIMEIRHFVKILLHKHPHIFYWLAQDTECLQNIIMCYADVETLYIGERKAIADYSMEEIITDGLPQQNVYIDVPNKTLMNWKKEIRKYAIKLNDLEGANKVIEEIDKIFTK